MAQIKTGSPFYLLSLSNMLDLIRRTSVHSISLLYFDGVNLTFCNNFGNNKITVSSGTFQQFSLQVVQCYHL